MIFYCRFQWARDHDNSILKICREANLKLNKDKCHFRCTSFPFFRENVSWDSTSPEPRKLKAVMDMTVPRCKKMLQSFLGTINYLSKFSAATAEVYELLGKLTISQGWVVMEWVIPKTIWQSQKVDHNGCMHEILWFVETFVLRDRCIWYSLGAILSQMREGMNCGYNEDPPNVPIHPIAFASNSLSGVEQWYSNMEWEALGYCYMGSRGFTTNVLQEKYICHWLTTDCW